MDDQEWGAILDECRDERSAVLVLDRLHGLEILSKDWTRSDLSGLEIHLVSCLGRVQHVLEEALKRRSPSCKLIALALERGMWLWQVTGLIRAAHRTIAICMREIYPSGFRGVRRRVRSRSDPDAHRSREGRLFEALQEGLRVVRALGLEDSLDSYVLKMGEVPRAHWFTNYIDTAPHEPKGK